MGLYDSLLESAFLMTATGDIDQWALMQCPPVPIVKMLYRSAQGMMH